MCGSNLPPYIPPTGDFTFFSVFLWNHVYRTFHTQIFREISSCKQPRDFHSNFFKESEIPYVNYFMKSRGIAHALRICVKMQSHGSDAWLHKLLGIRVFHVMDFSFTLKILHNFLEKILTYWIVGTTSCRSRKLGLWFYLFYDLIIVMMAVLVRWYASVGPLSGAQCVSEYGCTTVSGFLRDSVGMFGRMCLLCHFVIICWSFCILYHWISVYLLEWVYEPFL